MIEAFARVAEGKARWTGTAGKDPENKKFGLGFATPREMVLVMEKLELCNVPMASKYGALDRLRSAVGILYTKKGRIAMAISCDEMQETIWSVDNPAYLLISRLSQVLAEGLAKN